MAYGAIWVRPAQNWGKADVKALREHFRKCGRILEVIPIVSKNNTTEGEAFVFFASESAVQKALALDGSKIGEVTITVRPKKQNNNNNNNNKPKQQQQVQKETNQQQQQQQPKQKTSMILRVSNLAENVDEEVLFAKFQVYGQIDSITMEDAKVFSDGEFHKTATITFSSCDEATSALTALNGTTLFETPMNITYHHHHHSTASESSDDYSDNNEEGIMVDAAADNENDDNGKKQQPQKYKKPFGTSQKAVHVSNLSADVTKGRLKQLFSKCGAIVSVKMLKSKTIADTQVAIINYAKPEHAEKAVQEMHLTQYKFRTLYVKHAATNPTDKRRRKQAKKKLVTKQFTQEVKAAAAGGFDDADADADATIVEAEATATNDEDKQKKEEKKKKKKSNDTTDKKKAAGGGYKKNLPSWMRG